MFAGLDGLSQFLLFEGSRANEVDLDNLDFGSFGDFESSGGAAGFFNHAWRALTVVEG